MIFYLENVFLFFFSILAVFCSFFVIFSVNPIHSIFFLTLVFFNVSGLLFLLGIDYFALVFLIVYIGAIAVLFLFIIMMLNIKIIELKESFWRYMPIGFLISFIFFFEIFYIFFFYNNNIKIFQILDYINYINWISLFNSKSYIEVIGELLYTYYFFPFMLCGIILLVAMIGSITLTLNQSIKIKRQKIYKQTLRDSSFIILKNLKN